MYISFLILSAVFVNINSNNRCLLPEIIPPHLHGTSAEHANLKKSDFTIRVPVQKSLIYLKIVPPFIHNSVAFLQIKFLHSVSADYLIRQQFAHFIAFVIIAVKTHRTQICFPRNNQISRSDYFFSGYAVFPFQLFSDNRMR